MQPLDIGCFGLLQRSYQKQLRSWFTANPTALMNKAIFHGLLTVTRNEVYTMEVILAAWKKSGCWPIDLDRPATPPTNKAKYTAADTPGKMKQMAASIEADLAKVWEFQIM